MSRIERHPVASVIVATHNRADLLDECLKSILSDSSVVLREIIVVDNASADHTRSVVERAATGASLPVRYVVEEQLGHSAARNRGTKEARGEFLLFTDDDVLVADGWADALAGAFLDASIGAVGGRILPRWSSKPPPWIRGPHIVTLTLPDFGTERRFFAAGETPIGANMAFRSVVLRAFDPPFDPRVGHRGRSYGGAEEWLLCHRILASHRLFYEPSALVHHRITDDRIDWDYLRGAWLKGAMALARSERILGQPWPGAARRVVRAARTLRGARSIRRSNRSLHDPSAEDAWREFSSYGSAGRHIEMVLHGTPRLAEWIANRAAR
jgi:glucosyl-dolichyl phosphate glucuronosyltransferase